MANLLDETLYAIKNLKVGDRFTYSGCIEPDRLSWFCWKVGKVYTVRSILPYGDNAADIKVDGEDSYLPLGENFIHRIRIGKIIKNEPVLYEGDSYDGKDYQVGK